MINPAAAKKVVIVGAGIAGLSTAFLIRQIGRLKGHEPSITILESKSTPGGSTRTDIVDGYTCEWGPNGFLDNEPATLELIKMLGIEDRLVKADEASARRYIYHGGKMREVAMNPLKFLFSNILPVSAKLRVGMEYFIPANRSDGDETVYSFGERRLGKGFARFLLDPMVSGIFAGDIRELSLQAVFPNMYSMERQYGGLFKALMAKKRESRKTGVKSGGPSGPGAVLHTFKNGMGELTADLASRFSSEIKLSSKALSALRRNDSFIVKTENDTIETDNLILACPSYEAAAIIADMDKPTADKLDSIPYAPVDVVCHGFPEKSIEQDIRGFGVLVPRHEGIRSLGCLWSDSIFPGQAPDGFHILRTIMGGAHDYRIADETDNSVDQIAFNDMKTILGVRGKPGFRKIFRHPKGIAQYNMGHLDKIAAADNMEKNLPGLYFTGASYRGVSVNGSVKDAFRVAEKFWDMAR